MLRLLPLLLFAFISLGAYAQTKNGFDLSDSLIDPAEIRGGGPPRDGIPAIDAPVFLGAAAAEFLQPGDRVMGVVRNGVAKAYPLRIMNWHEIVNDEFAGARTLISYCPLCGTGMVFDVDNPDVEFSFGVSGLLYNSDVLLYDRQTESLWSQIMGKAVSGPLKSSTLELLPSQNTTWQRWRDAHPDTLVLSTDTGVNRDYDHSPYLDYARSDRLLFDVAYRSDAYRNKALVMGVVIEGAPYAYPLEELASNGRARFSDELAGREVTVVWDEDANSAALLDASGAELPTVLAYWFAWYAFHPDTGVFVAQP